MRRGEGAGLGEDGGQAFGVGWAACPAGSGPGRACPAPPSSTLRPDRVTSQGSPHSLRSPGTGPSEVPRDGQQVLLETAQGS